MEIIILTVVSVWITGIICSRIAARYVQAQWKLPQVMQKEEQAAGELCVLFKKKMFFGKIRIYIQFTNQMTGESYKQICKLKAHGMGQTVKEMDMQYRYSGTVQCVIDKIRIYDWYGITFRTIKTHKEQGILVLPQMEDVRQEEMLIQMEQEDGDIVTADIHGYDYSEPLGIREYRMGDSPKSIHWKMTGRLGELYVKEAGIPAVQVMVVLAETIHETMPIPQQCDALSARLLAVCRGLTDRQQTYDVVWYDHVRKTFTVVHATDVEDVRTVMYQFMKCRQIQGQVTGRRHYERLYPQQGFLYIG